MQRGVDNIEVAYIGTDINYFNPNTDIPKYEYLKKKYAGKKVILFPNRFEYLKRPLFLARVIAEIVKTRKDIICVAAGYGKAKEDMDRVISEYNIKEYFEIVGKIDDLRPYYKVASVTVVCSLTEGLTLTAYESLAMGTPVVTADVGGQKELVDNTCGRVIKKYQSIEKDLHNYNYSDSEIKEYKEAIIDIINRKDGNLENICRQKVINGFSIENMIEQMDSSFNSMIINGTNVELSICKNIEIAERYLVLFNEYYKQTYFNPDEVEDRTRMQKFRDKLWNFGLYRGFIYMLQKTGVMNVLKGGKRK